MSTYVPTGGQFNDPNQWKTTPSFGQTPGEANEGAGYNPAYWADKGGFDAYHAGRQAYRAQFQPGGAGYDKYMKTYAAIGAARPQNERQLGQVLNGLGVYNQRGAGQSLYRSIGMDFNNQINGNYQYNQPAGMKLDVATSDRNKGWEPMTTADWGNVNKGFYGRIDDMFGAGRFAQWNAQGRTGMPTTANGLYYNPGPNGQPTSYYNQQGWATDQNGNRIGGGYMPYMGTTGSMYGHTYGGSGSGNQPSYSGQQPETTTAPPTSTLPPVVQPPTVTPPQVTGYSPATGDPNAQPGTLSSLMVKRPTRNIRY